MVEQEERIVKTLCRMCGISCGIDAYVKGDKIVRREPAEEFRWLGGHCPRWGAVNEFQYSLERLTHPLKRVNGDFERISWDEAYDIIVNKLHEIKEKYGPEAVAVNCGHPHIGSEINWILRRFADAFGTPHIPDGGCYCWVPREVSDYITFGDFMQPSYRGAKCVVFWCHNPMQSAPAASVRKMLKDKKDAGDKFIVVDPRAIELAKMADVHLQIRPGTDGALALAMLNVIISEGLYDKDFVGKWTVHFDKLAEHVKQYPPEWAAGVTWSPADLIIKAARIYATTKPATMAWGVGLDQHDNAFQSIRAISCLKAITGNVDTPGGSVLLRYPPFDLSIPEKTKLLKKPIGYDKYALWYDECTRKMNPSRVPLSMLVDAILDGKIHAVLFTGKEMIIEDPNAKKTTEAFRKLDLLVNMDIVMSPTCKLSHVVLPACTFFERNGIRSYQAGGGLALISAINKAVEPLGESRSDIEFWLELGKRIGLGKDFPWNDELELLDDMLKQIGTTWDWLSKNRPGFFYMPRKTRRYEQDGFDTPSGKVELYSEKLKKYGYDPLPTFKEAAETPVSRPDLLMDFPLVLTSGGRTFFYDQSQLRHLWSLRAKFPEPLMEINPEDAQKYGIGDKDLVEVESPRGLMEAKAHVTEDMMKGVVHIYHGFWGKGNVNQLTLDTPVDPVSSSSNLRSVLCRVRSLHIK
jgi:anaerobic selenocysteine-containing dehydrogenase